MELSRRTLRNWTGVVIGFAVLYSVLAIVALSNAGAEPGQFNPTLGAIVAVVAVLYWFAAMLIGAKIYGGARACLIIGGIISFPLGMVMITAGRRIVDASADLEQREGELAYQS